MHFNQNDYHNLDATHTYPIPTDPQKFLITSKSFPMPRISQNPPTPHYYFPLTHLLRSGSLLILQNPLLSLRSDSFLIPNIIHTLLFNHSISPLPKRRRLALQIGQETLWQDLVFRKAEDA